ncbi:MAG TPA: amino acid adenylation domain-containing protein [Streptosporangiaceae bacterium]|nr:amino acid adenylation domain-containing protein [Streptosporangiaceae bacterium]
MTDLAMRPGTRIPVPDGTVIPMTEGQEALYFLQELEPESRAYYVPLAVRVRSAIDPALMREAFWLVLDRHELLRCRVDATGERPVLAAGRASAESFAVLDAQGLTPAGLATLIDAEIRRHIDLASGPLIRVRLLPDGQDEWVLLIVAHHLVVDMSSMVTIGSDLLTAYAALGGGKLPAWAPIAAGPSDFARWQARWLDSEAARRALSYFRTRLPPADRVLDLPTDWPRRPGRQGSGAIAVGLNDAVQRGLDQFAATAGVSPVAVMLAIWAAFLGRHCGEHQVVVTVPATCRPGRAYGQTVGYFVNPLPVLVDLGGDPDLAEAAGRAGAAMAGALRNRHYPFARLVRELAGQHARGDTPLMQFMLSVEQPGQVGAGGGLPENLRDPRQDAGPASMSFAGLDLELLPAGNGGAQADLALILGHGAGGLSLSLRYDAGLFSEPTAARLAERLRTFATAAITQPGRALSACPLIGAGERQIIEEASGRGVRHRSGWSATIPELVARRAGNRPGAIAISQGADRVSYRELTGRAWHLAAGLRAAGITRGDRVAVALPRTPELVVVLLAIMAAGAAYVPLDPAYPGDRLRYMVADSQAALLVAEPSMAQALGLDLPVVQPGRPGCAGLGSCPPSGGPRPRDVAYLMYTSGSTGKPKGVAVEHRSVVQLADWARAALPAQDLAAVLAITSACFDLSVFELFVTLMLGGEVVLAAGPGEVLDAGFSCQARVLNTVPTVAAELVAAGRVPATVRTVVLCGEPLRADLARALGGLPGVTGVRNLYGPTEDTVYSTAALVDPGQPGDPPIGRPIPGTTARVLDDRMALVPIGVPGELYLGGAGLARGYHQAPGLTADRFLPDPHGDPGDRLYRTGDVVRLRADGQLEFLSRNDRQIKVRGVRVEAGEIEAALRAHPAVRDAVAAPAGPPGRQVLTGYVGCPGAGPDQAELLAFLRERLPPAIVPAAIVVLPSLPRLPNGKTDTAALPPPGAQGNVAAEAGQAGHLAVELAGIFAEVLGLPSVAPDDDFFLLGGHSLIAARIVERARARLGVTVQLRWVFMNPTPATLAEHLKATAPAAAAAVAAAAFGSIRPADRSGPLPLSSGQQRLWFLQKLSPYSVEYTVPAVFAIEGPLRADALRQALRALASRHEILRTRYPTGPDDLPAQVIEPAGDVPLRLADLRSMPPEQARVLARERIFKSFSEPIDLAAGPVLRAFLVTIRPREHVFALALHHIACDDYTLRMLGYELTELYSAFASGTAADLRAPSLQYADFAAWQQQASLPGLAGQLDFWRQHLRDLRPVRFTARPAGRAPAETGARRVHRMTLPAGTARIIRSVARAGGTTPFAVLLSLFAGALGRERGLSELPIATFADVRVRPEFEAIAGFCVNTIVVACDLTGEPSAAELVSRIATAFGAAFDHREVPFEHVVRSLRTRERMRDAAALADVHFLMQQPYPELRAADLRLRPVHVESVAAKAALALVVTQDDDYDLAFEYQPGQVPDQAVARIADSMARLAADLGLAPVPPAPGRKGTDHVAS